jgi:hypothetical protein
MIETMKSSVRILEYAAEILEEKALEGRGNLVKLGFPHNLVHMPDTLIDNEKGIATLSAAQSNPALILKSLALEQSLKILILQETRSHSRGHNFHSLFIKLPDVVRNSIRTDVIMNTEITEIDFEKILQQNSEVFIKQRYIYEPLNWGNTNLKFLNTLYASIKSKIKQNVA